MKKLFLIGAIAIAVLVVFVLQSMAQAGKFNGCDACANKKNGQLRLVSSTDKCRKSEEYVNLCQPSGSTSGQLECVTGVLRYEPSQVPNYCQDTYSMGFTNPYPTDMNPNDVFNVYCVSPVPDDDDLVNWGLICNKVQGWQNTGCTGSNNGFADLDLNQWVNGCYSDDNEYGNATMYVTCCKIAP